MGIMEKLNGISAIIIAKNVAGEIIPALLSVKFCQEIIVVDNGSTDNTIEIAQKHGAKIIRSASTNFADWRNEGAELAASEWLLYIDSDERIDQKLASEIQRVVKTENYSAYEIPRYEIFLGKHLENWGDSFVLRLIKKSKLKKWQGKLHEQPQIDGSIGSLKNTLLHLSHKNIDEKVLNTLEWSKSEAKMLFDSNHPPMVWWRFPRVMFTEFWQRAVKQGLWKDGTEGWIEIIYQMFSVFMTYERLWEMQRKPSLKEAYNQIDKDFVAKLKQSS